MAQKLFGLKIIKSTGENSLVNNHQRGFTLVEILIGIAITALIGIVVAGSLSQTVSFSWASNKRMEAVKQAENATYRINRDAQVAAAISTGISGDWLSLDITGGGSIAYRLIQPLDGGPFYLQRSQGTTVESVAKYINTDPDKTYCSYTGSVLNARITVTVGGFGSATETRKLTIYPRLNQ
jgi:prepilin-type N-terminal cleavage/methylation domain-containing protein